MKNKNTEFINSVNLNKDTNFPYLVLNVINDKSYPLNPGFRTMHWHSDLQFIYVTDGKIAVKTLTDEKIISQGEGIFINRNIVHFIDKIDKCTYNSFIFPEYFLSFYAGSPAADLTFRITENNVISTIAFDKKTGWHKKVLNNLNKLVTLEQEKDQMYCYDVLLTLSQIWYEILKNTKITNKNKESNLSIRTRCFLEYIEDNYKNEITLNDLAKSANVSKSECLRCFKKTLGITPYKYLMDFRLSKAEKLLFQTDLTILEIAVQTGFNNQSYFGKCFKERMGLSPKEYRKINKII